MANYYRRFIKDYAKIASPLNSLLKKNQRFCWTPQCQKAFDLLKDKLTSAPILSYPRFDLPFILTTDASDFSIGYMLSQVQDGKEHAIHYGGRSLRDTELKWHITDKEALALVESVQTFKHYLAGNKFTVFTDNVSVKYLQKIKDCNGRLGRWSLLLQAYDFEIKHKPGKSNPADFLSRQSYSNKQPTISSELSDHVGMLDQTSNKRMSQITFVYEGESEDAVVASLENPSVPDYEIQRPDLATLQYQCPDFFDIYNYKLNNIVPDDPFVARTVVAEAYNFEVENGVLKHFYSRRAKNIPRDERLVKQIAVPKVLRDDVLRSYHDCIAGGGHQGFERTYAALRNKYFWPAMYADIKKYVQSCEVCQRSKRDFHARPPPLHPLPVDDVLSRWHMDILSGIPTTKDKYKHILLVVDSSSKWCEAFPLRTQEATEVAAVLYREVFTRFGAPRALITDRAQNFTSKLIQALCELFKVTRHLTSSYHPETNGIVEKMNSVVLQALRAYTRDQQDDWPELLPGIMMAYRATPATQSTNFSPYFMLFGREMRLPIDTTLIPKEHLAQGHKEFLSSMLHNLEKARKLAAENIEIAQQRYKRQHDKRAKPPEYRPAQRVWLYCTKVPLGKAPKLHCKWVGPYYITQVGPNHTFKLRNCATNKEVKSLVNACRLKQYYDPADRPTNPPPELEHNDAELDPEELPDQDQPQVQQPQARQPPHNRPIHQQQQPRNHAKQPTHKRPGIPPQQRQQKHTQGSKHSKPPQSKQCHKPQVKNQVLSDKPQPSSSNVSKPSNLQQSTRPKVQRMPHITKQNTEKLHSSQTPSTSTAVSPPQNSASQKSKMPISNTKPACQDCLRGNCNPFHTEEIDAIVSSARGNGTLYYKVKFIDNEKHPTEWYFPCKIPSHLIRQFHANRTMQGKKRKRPLNEKQHKFFDNSVNVVETIQQSCHITTQTEDHTKTAPLTYGTSSGFVQSTSLQDKSTDPPVRPGPNDTPVIIGFKVSKGKPFYSVQDLLGDVRMTSVLPIRHQVTHLYYDVRNVYDKMMLDFDIEELTAEKTGKMLVPDRQPGVIYPGDFWLPVDNVLEMRTTPEGKREFLFNYRNPKVPPDWMELETLPPAAFPKIFNLIADDYFFDLKKNREYT